jgi:DNA-binding beta-propeller fold protein YncE
VNGNYSLEFQGTSSSLSASTSVALTIATATGTLPGNRTNFVRTDSTPSGVVFDTTHKLIYAALPGLSRVSVIDPTSNQVVRQIPVPDASGISLSPDSTRVLVSGLAQQVAWIETSTQQIVERDILPLLQPTCSGCPPEMVFPGIPMVLASGKVLFIGSTAFLSGILEWDPVAGQIIQLNPHSTYAFGQGTIGVRSTDGSKALFSTNTVPGSIALFDSATDGFVATRDFSNFPFSMAANPNGTQFVVAVDQSTTSVLDSQLNIQGQVPVGGTLNGVDYSPDGRTLYVVGSPGNVPLLSSVDATSFQLAGQAPAYSSSIAYVSRVPPLFTEIPQAADSTGMLFGIGDHGVALDDSTFFQNISSTATAPTSAIIAEPAEGSLTADTSVAIATQSFNTAPDVWFGTANGKDFSLNSLGQALATASPFTSAGPVNVKIISPDGTEANIPEAFTYGAITVDSPILAAPPSGAVIADIFGYGFGSDIPNPIQVQVGNNAASIQRNALFPAEYIFGYPFPLDHIRFTVPSGISGPADITITSATGSAKILGGLHYEESVNDYPSSDTFQFILYDSSRQQLYLSAGTHIDVFSISAHAFASPINPPSIGGTSQILGLALTPDGSKLLAANYSDNSVAIIDPDNPSTAQAVSIVPPGSPYVEGPTELAATSTNHAFITISNSNQVSGGTGAIYDLDLSTLSVTLVPVGVLQISGNYLSASRDGSKVFVVVPGVGPAFAYVWSASNGTWSTGQPGSLLFDGSTSGDGNVFSVDSGNTATGTTTVGFVDSAVDRTALTGQPEYLAASPAVGGMKLNDSGSLLYVPVFANVPFVTPTPSENFVDIYDVQRNELKERVVFSEQFPSSTQVMNAMALDITGQNIFLITPTGLTIATLDAVPLSVGSMTPSTLHAGSTITIRGSGFSHSTTATFNGTQANLTFVDQDTLQATVPSSLVTGAVSINLTDPDGFSYSLDSAFTVN